MRNQPVVCQCDVFDVRGVKTEVAHRRRPVEEGGEARAGQCLLEAGYLRVLDAERNNAKAYHDAGMGATRRGPAELPLNLSMPRRIPYPLTDR